jgi:hypothetical protein
MVYVGIFDFMQVDPGSLVAYRADNTYSIKFRPAHSMPQNGYLKIWFPKEVAVPDYNFSESGCLADENTGFPSR